VKKAKRQFASPHADEGIIPLLKNLPPLLDSVQKVIHMLQFFEKLFGLFENLHHDCLFSMLSIMFTNLNDPCYPGETRYLLCFHTGEALDKEAKRSGIAWIF
jgi:hypothetical protein